ncbi:unnamed protein product [Soboliphyme baturini]|uniref:Uncharacterized protein n=1 Tax=Soboliphyme baturini TaxID=241478 RepID=A0A183IBA5_9BILA|nr:unnamed protein product [Soboliphyme baturini]
MRVVLSVSDAEFIEQNEEGSAVCRRVGRLDPCPSSVGIFPERRVASVPCCRRFHHGHQPTFLLILPFGTVPTKQFSPVLPYPILALNSPFKFFFLLEAQRANLGDFTCTRRFWETGFFADYNPDSSYFLRV